MIQTVPWLLAIYLYIPVFRTLYQSRWAAIDYTHAYFILPLSLLIVWLKRDEIKQHVTSRVPHPTSYVPGFILLVFGLASFTLGWRWGYLFISTLSLIPFLFGMCLFLYNKELAKTLAFPILYLLLLVPIPVGILDSITLPMRYAASVASAAILKVMGYDIVREGLLINMGGHEIFMGAPCSGFRSLITMISLGLIYIYFTKGTMSKNIILFISIIPLALIGNLARIIALCLITFYFGEAAGQGFFHNFSGMVVFLIIILGLMALEKFLNKKFITHNS
jgi:exosortase